MPDLVHPSNSIPETCCRKFDHLLEHFGRQAPGIGVEAGAVERIEQIETAREKMPGAVGERKVPLLDRESR